MHPDADLSLRGVGRIVAELLERLDLRDVTLCFNDWGGAQVMIADGLVDRVGRLALIACEAFENYPPGLPGRLAALSARMPGRDRDDAPRAVGAQAAGASDHVRPDVKARRAG